jgi:hypothetical protein
LGIFTGPAIEQRVRIDVLTHDRALQLLHFNLQIVSGTGSPLKISTRSTLSPLRSHEATLFAVLFSFPSSSHAIALTLPHGRFARYINPLLSRVSLKISPP